tara:strand:- start:275 stop:1222 length:948 start_codon:yes stop_codon:yes gene_type:complete
MKNIFKILLSSIMIVSFSCSDDDTVTSEMLDTFENGGALRTVEIINDLFNSSDPTSAFMVEIEAQDEQDGGLMQEVRVIAEFIDFTSDFITPPTGDALIKTIPASDFEIGEFGLPRTTVSVTFQEVSDVFGLTLDPENGYQPGDVMRIKLELVLTDGRVYGPDSAASIITGGFFSSPFQYNALISCSPAYGDYVVEMYDGYGDGWQSTGVEVCVDGNCTTLTIPATWPTVTNYVTQIVSVPQGTQTLTWSWPGDTWTNEVWFVVYAPDGSLLYAGSGEPTGDMALYSNGAAPSEDVQAAGVQMGVGLLPIALCAE